LVRHVLALPLSPPAFIVLVGFMRGLCSRRGFVRWLG
jgi:hypothetical protein